MRDRNENGQAPVKPRRLGTEGASLVEYILLVGIVALAAIWGFKVARIRESRAIAMEARIVKSLDTLAPADVDFTDPIFGDDWDTPRCNAEGTVCSAPGQCFAAGTPVATERGLEPIETIREGDLIWSRDERTGAIELRPVLKRFVTPHQEVIDLPIAAGDGGETLRVTTGHQFWVTGQGWVDAADLTFDELLWSSNGEPLHLGAAPTDEPGDHTVYNFEIGELHTYFVGRHGVWVHNGVTSQIAPCKRPKPGTIDFARDKWIKNGFPLGGSYRDIVNARNRDNDRFAAPKRIGGEVHHMPAKDVWNNWPKGQGKPPFTDDDGPAIWLEEADHEKTKSYGSSAAANDYRAKQAALVQKGDICGALNMDIQDVRRIAKDDGDPDKYEDGIQQLLAYVRSKGYNCRGPRS